MRNSGGDVARSFGTKSLSQKSKVNLPAQRETLSLEVTRELEEAEDV